MKNFILISTKERKVIINSPKIIFLDIDGVLNSKIFELKRELTECYVPYYSDIDPENIKKLKELIERTNSKIVIHSSWRDTFSLEEFKDFFNHFGLNKDYFIGVTSDEMDKVPSIKKYLIENDIREFVILEDENIFGLKDELNHKLYKVSPRGLSSEDIEKIILVLNS